MASFDTKPHGAHTPYAMIGAAAEYKRLDYYFGREQSPLLRDAEWESRIRPLRPWKDIAVIGLLGAMSVATALAIF